MTRPKPLPHEEVEATVAAIFDWLVRHSHTDQRNAELAALWLRSTPDSSTIQGVLGDALGVAVQCRALCRREKWRQRIEPEWAAALDDSDENELLALLSDVRPKVTRIAGLLLSIRTQREELARRIFAHPDLGRFRRFSVLAAILIRAVAAAERLDEAAFGGSGASAF